MKTTLKFIALCVFFLMMFLEIFSQSTMIPPSHKYDLSGWKLQIPGPFDVKNLNEYASKYFYLDSLNRMCFWLDCTEKGSTKNSTYVRSELRHLDNWKTSETRMLSASIQVNSKALPDKVTVLQIHGITADKQHAPPLLRVALNSGDLYAFVKTDTTGDNTEKVLLAKAIGMNVFNCLIRVENKQLTIDLNGEEKLKRDISFWIFDNYFKAGCYPQAHNGEVLMMITNLRVK